MPNFRFQTYHVLTRQILGALHLSDVTFNSPVSGVGGGLTATAPLSPRQDTARLRQRTEPDVAALLIYCDGELLPWGGPIISRPWNPDRKNLSITAVSWKQWLYTRFLGMDRSTNPVKEKLYGWAAQDQLLIARQIIEHAIDDDGCPNIVVGSELSGVNRDLNIAGSSFTYAGDAIDKMAHRDGGFEWDIEVRSSSVDGLPELRFVPFYPEKGSTSASAHFRYTLGKGGNIISMPSSVEDSVENSRSRVWATGEGTPPNQPTVYDQDPSLPEGFRLLRENVSNYSSVKTLSTLAEHARSERRYRNAAQNTISLIVGLETPAYTSYGSGDRVRLSIQDEWLNLDLPGVRIVDKKTTVNTTSSGPDRAEVTLDLLDFELPTVEEP